MWFKRFLRKIKLCYSTPSNREIGEMIKEIEKEYREKEKNVNLRRNEFIQNELLWCNMKIETNDFSKMAWFFGLVGLFFNSIQIEYKSDIILGLVICFCLIYVKCQGEIKELNIRKVTLENLLRYEK